MTAPSPLPVLALTAAFVIAHTPLAMAGPGATSGPWDTSFTVDELEYRAPLHGGRDEIGWGLGARFGNDLEGVELTFEGDSITDGSDSLGTDTELLYTRSLGEKWEGQIGVEYVNSWSSDDYTDLWSGVLVADFDPGNGFTIGHTLYLSEAGDALVEVEVDYLLSVSETLALESGVDLVIAPDDIPQRGIKSGATETELDLLLVHEGSDDMSPYIGLRYIAALGGTRDLAEAAGEDTQELFLLIGTRIRF